MSPIRGASCGEWESRFLQIPYPDEHFDTVARTCAFHPVPHLLKPRAARETLRVLKRGGGVGPW
jgi:ubiquinone/menaquinone biosynthesis C-methylase UbiE